MKHELQLVVFTAALAACTGHGEEDPVGAADVTDAESDVQARIDELCRLANACFQPDAEPSDIDWCSIPTAVDADGGVSGVSFDSSEQSSDERDPCDEQLKRDYPEEYLTALECERDRIEAGIAALEGTCPETVPVLDNDDEPDCFENSELIQAYERCQDELDSED
jgi:hypothetical protein